MLMTVSEFIQICIDDFFEELAESGNAFEVGRDRSFIYDDLCVLLAASKNDRFYVIDFGHINTATVLHMLSVFWTLKRCESEVLEFFKYFIK